MDNGYGYYSQGSSVWTSKKNEEFQEEDVWGVLNERKDSDFLSMSSFKEPGFNTNRHPKATKTIPISNKNSNFQESMIVQHSSAPVNIPDWSKIYGTTSKQKSCSGLDDDGSDNDHGFARSSWESDDDEEEEVDEKGNVIPPHELIARKLARNQISSFSVCEGVGRTLKGRDLSRVRNAVLTKTGFLESNHNH